MIDYRHDMTPEQKLNLSRAMFNIGRMNEVRPAYDFIVEELHRLDVLNRKEPENAQFRIRQGASQVLEDLKNMIDDARDRFADFDNMRRKAESGVGSGQMY